MLAPGVVVPVASADGIVATVALGVVPGVMAVDEGTGGILYGSMLIKLIASTFKLTHAHTHTHTQTTHTDVHTDTQHTNTLTMVVQWGDPA